MQPNTRQTFAQSHPPRRLAHAVALLRWLWQRRALIRDCDKALDLPPHLLRDVGLTEDKVRAERQRLRDAFWRLP